MSVATELTKLQGYMDDAFDAVEEKGGTLPTTECMAELADAILSIATGGGAVATLSNITIANSTNTVEGTVPVGGALIIADFKGTSRYNTSAMFKQNNSSGAYANFQYKQAGSSSLSNCAGTIATTYLNICFVNNNSYPIYYRVTGDSHSITHCVISPATS